jgi:hypothetical protein
MPDGSFVITVPLDGFESKSAELAHVQFAVDAVIKLTRGSGGAQSSGTVTGGRHVAIASYRYQTNCQR